MKDGWRAKQLGEVCSFLNRGISPVYLEDGGVCVLNQKCVREHRVSYGPSRRHDAQSKTVGIERFIQAGDVLVNSTGTGTLGRVGQLRENPPEPTTVDSHVTIVRPVPGRFCLEFFGYMLVEVEDAIKEAGEGCGGQTELARSTLAEKLTVRYPESLPEQQRIVGILDEAFEGIATAKANAERNLQNARALFESHLHSVFNQRGDGWVEKKLGDIAEVQSGGTPSVAKQNYWGGDIPWYSSGELNDTFTTHPERSITDAGLNNSNAKLFPRGSLLLGMYDTAALKMSVLDRAGAFNQAIAGVRPNDAIEVEFVLHAITASKPTLLLERRGVRQKNLSLGKIRGIAIPLPGLSEQRAVVSQLRSLGCETQRLVALYQQKLVALEALKKSLLHQAFAGRL